MLFGGHAGTLELRRAGGSTRLHGEFPYNAVAVLSDGGREGPPRKEKIASRAFAYRVEQPTEDVHLLVGHDFGQPLASKLTGTLSLRDTAKALLFDALIPPEMERVSWVTDILAAVGVGLAVGLSPGFRIPPKRAVEDAEEITQEPVDPENGNHGAIIRTVKEALLYELSIVTKPAYPDAQVQMRSWDVPEAFGKVGPPTFLKRWRY